MSVKYALAYFTKSGGSDERYSPSPYYYRCNGCPILTLVLLYRYVYGLYVVIASMLYNYTLYCTATLIRARFIRVVVTASACTHGSCAWPRPCACGSKTGLASVSQSNLRLFRVVTGGSRGVPCDLVISNLNLLWRLSAALDLIPVSWPSQFRGYGWACGLIAHAHIIRATRVAIALGVCQSAT